MGHGPVLGLDICWDKEQIRLRDPSTGDFIPTPKESAVHAKEAEARADATDAEIRLLRERIKMLEHRPS